MNVLTQLRRQFEYDFWANREEIRVLSALPDPPPSALRLMTHIIAAQQLWLDRLQRRPQSMPVWPEPSLAGCDAQLQNTQAEWRSYLGQLSDDALTTPCSYKNSKGEPWENSVLDVLNHVLLHSAYHRGQVASQLRSSGHTPAYTDYIHAVRQSHI